MSSLASVLLAALLGGGFDASEAERLEPVAAAMADAALETPLWESEAGELATGLALVAIAQHESGLREPVRRCEVRGDRGASVGLYQIRRPWSWQGYEQDEICADDDLQARLALGVLRRHRERCPACPPAFLFRAYASGDGGRDTPAARRIAGAWMRLAARAGVVVNPSSSAPPRATERP